MSFEKTYEQNRVALNQYPYFRHSPLPEFYNADAKIESIAEDGTIKRTLGGGGYLTTADCTSNQYQY